MAERRPLVNLAGSTAELPAGDVVPGVNARHPFAMPRVGDWLAQAAVNVSTQSYANGELRAGLLYLPGPFTYDAVMCRISSAGSSGAVIKVVAYADDNGRPGTLVLDTATVAATSTGTTMITGLSLVVPAGGLLMWAGTVAQGGPATVPTLFRVSLTGFPAITPTAPDLSYQPSIVFQTTGITGTAPSASGTTVTDGHARLAFRRSA